MDIKEFLKEYGSEENLKKLLEVGSSSKTTEEAQDIIEGIFKSCEEGIDDVEGGIAVFRAIADGAEKLFWLAKDIGADGEGENKRVFVVSTLTALYLYIDRGPEGDKNRINLPWIPSTIENFIEEKGFPVIATIIVEALYAQYKDKIKE